MYVKSLRDHGKLLAEGERPAEQASGDDVKSVYENVRSSKTGMSDKVPGKPAAATAQETGDEVCQQKHGTTTPSRCCWNRRQLLATPLLTSSWRTRCAKLRMQSRLWWHPKVVARWRILEARARQRRHLREGPRACRKDPVGQNISWMPEADHAAKWAIAVSSMVADSHQKNWKELGKDIMQQVAFPATRSPAPAKHRVRDGMVQ